MIKHVVAFLLIGSALYFAEQIMLSYKAKPQKSIHVSLADVEDIKKHYHTMHKEYPSNAMLQQLIHNTVNARILIDQALDRQLHVNDSVIRERVVLNMKFLEQGERKNAQALFEQGVALGMLDTDLVVKKRLQRQMADIVVGQMVSLPTDSVLLNYYQANKNNYTRQNSYQLSHWFYNVADVNANQLRQLNKLPKAIQSLTAEQNISDWLRKKESLIGVRSHSFLSSKQFLSFNNVTKILGGTLAHIIVKPNNFGQLIFHPDDNGYHLLWVHAKTEGEVKPFVLVKDAVMQDYLTDTHKAALPIALKALRQQYAIRIDEYAAQYNTDSESPL